MRTKYFINLDVGLMQGGDWFKVAGGMKRNKVMSSQNLMLR